MTIPTESNPKIICASNMPYALEAFGTLGNATVVDGRTMSAEHVRDARILATRSTTEVNAELLDGSSVEFVGTATIGTDHMDIDYLETAGIRWCYSPGCNANSVSEYVTSALLCLANRHGFTLEDKIIGVVGVGNVGSLVVRKAETLGLTVLQNDPPRERNEPPEGRPPFVSLDRVVSESDIVTFHVPLTKDGADATFHMADAGFFAQLKPGCVFLNCARGPVNDTDALLGAMASGQVAHTVIDTWEPEPAYRHDLLERVDIATPHIAGHSFEGKVGGTVMVYREACAFLGREPNWSPDDLLPEPVVPHISVDAAGRADEAVLWEIVRQVYDIESDDARLRDLADPSSDSARVAHFDGLRKKYPMRREFRFTTVTLENPSEALAGKVRGLGFQTAQAGMPALPEQDSTSGILA